MNGNPTLEQMAKANGLALCAAGAWTASFAPRLERIVAEAEKLAGSRANIFIDVSQVSKLDTFGAWLLERLRRSLSGEKRKNDTEPALRLSDDGEPIPAEEETPPSRKRAKID